MAGGEHEAAEDPREKYSQEESIQTTLERRDGMEYSRTSPGWTDKTKGGGREGEAHVERCRFNSSDLIPLELMR